MIYYSKLTILVVFLSQPFEKLIMDIETIHATRENTPESYAEYASWYYGKAILGTRTTTKTESASVKHIISK
jgi:hypothetical protein